MAIYQVALSRRKSRASHQAADWTQPVEADTAAEAMRRAHANWVASSPARPVPPLERVGKLAQRQGTLLAEAATALDPAQQEFTAKFEAAVATALGKKLDGKFSAVNYPNGFNYGITYGPNAYFNQATLKDLDGLLGTSSSGGLILTGGDFSTLYAQLLQTVGFVFSAKDAQTMQDQDTKAESQIASVLTEFENAGGEYSDPLPFGGKIQDVYDQLLAQYGSIAKLPTSLGSLRNAIAAYQKIASQSYKLHESYYKATDRLNAAIDAVQYPTKENGGIQVNSAAYYVDYNHKKLPTVNKLIAELQNTKSQVKMSLVFNNFEAMSSQVSIQGGAKVSIPLGSILGISLSASASYSVTKYTSSASTMTMNVSYPGVTTVAALPTELAANSLTGWYDNNILTQVADNSPDGNDFAHTGYAFLSGEYDPKKYFGVGKLFSRLKTFVISQEPTMELVFTGVDVSTVQTDFKVGASAQLKLFGLFSLGSGQGEYQVKEVKTSSLAGQVTVTFGPASPPSGTVPLAQQVAYVLGGVASYPPTNI